MERYLLATLVPLMLDVVDRTHGSRPAAAGLAHVGEATEGAPCPGTRPHLLISGDRWDDGA